MPPPRQPPAAPPCPREDCLQPGCEAHCPACGWNPVTEGHDWNCRVLRSYPACRSCYGTGRHPGNIQCPNCWGYGRKQLSGPVIGAIGPLNAKREKQVPAPGVKPRGAGVGPSRQPYTPTSDDALLG